MSPSPRSPRGAGPCCVRRTAPSAMDLCKRQVFDDFVTYSAACRRTGSDSDEACAAEPGARRPWRCAARREAGAKLLDHAQPARGLDRKITHEIRHGRDDRPATTRGLDAGSRTQTRKASDEFSNHLTQGGTNSAVEVKDPAALKRDLAQFKSQQLELARAARERAVKPMSTWAQQLRGKVEPALAESRNFAAQVGQARPTLLVIGDDDTSRGLLTPSLRSLGYDPVVARDGNHVLSQLARTRPDAIIMDIVSSSTEAVSLTRELKALPDIAHIPIIIVSGDSRRETLLSSIRAGASDFIAKPFTHEILRAKLGKVLRQPAQA